MPIDPSVYPQYSQRTSYAGFASY